MTDQEAREEICRIGKSLFDRGYVHATAGNISVRLDASEGGGILITPTDACLGFLEPARLARIDAEGNQTSGDRASKTIALHEQIYQATAGHGEPARCIIHTHSTHCVAMTLRPAHLEPGEGARQPELLPPVTPYFVMKVGHVPVIPYRRPGDPAAAFLVAQAISLYAARGTPVRAVMLERLGPNVWHDTPAAAMATLEELEETARLVALSPTLPAPLSAEQIDALRHKFGARW